MTYEGKTQHKMVDYVDKFNNYHLPLKNQIERK